MNAYVFPAKFILRGEGDGYYVAFPDLPGCSAKGYSLDESVRNAKVALELYLAEFLDTDGIIPKASSIENVLNNDKEFVRLIEADEANMRVILNSNFHWDIGIIIYQKKRLVFNWSLFFCDILNRS